MTSALEARHQLARSASGESYGTYSTLIPERGSFGSARLASYYGMGSLLPRKVYYREKFTIGMLFWANKGRSSPTRTYIDLNALISRHGHHHNHFWWTIYHPGLQMAYIPPRATVQNYKSALAYLRYPTTHYYDVASTPLGPSDQRNPNARCSRKWSVEDSTPLRGQLNKDKLDQGPTPTSSSYLWGCTWCTFCPTLKKGGKRWVGCQVVLV